MLDAETVDAEIKSKNFYIDSAGKIVGETPDCCKICSRNFVHREMIRQIDIHQPV
jgi:hypothetical protein